MSRLVVAAAISALVALAAWAHFPASPLPVGTHADRVVVRKSARTFEIYLGDKLLRAYSISLGRVPNGPKQQEGDGRTPEGKYSLDYRKADSAYHRALHISYPSPNDVTSANARGVHPGGFVMVHGVRHGLGFLGRIHRFIDWTDGCIAVTNREIEEIWRVVPDSTPIFIEP